MALTVTHRFVSPKAEQSDPTIVGPNEWNAIHTTVDTNALTWSNDYIFPAIAPGGTLTAGISNTVTLTPVPIGVNGTDVGHWVYISSGTGTAESVLITGGTAVSGAASGTITFTPANNHSGAWTIQTATSGIQEAINKFLPNGYGTVWVPGGGFTNNVYAPITVKPSIYGMVIRGISRDGSTTIFVQTPNIQLFTFTGGGGCGLYDISVHGMTGGTDTSGWHLVVNGHNRFQCERVTFHDGANGVHTTDLIYSSFRDVDIENFTGIGLLCDGVNENVTTYDTLSIDSQPTAIACLKITQSGQTEFISCSFLGSVTGCLMAPAGGQGNFSIDFVSCYFDHNATNAVLMQPTGGGTITRTRFTHCWMSSSQRGLIIDTTGGFIQDTIVVGSQISANPGNGVSIIGTQATSIQITNCKIFNNNGASGIYTSANVNGLIISNNFIGNDSSWGAGSQAFGIFLANTTQLVMTGNIFNSNATAPIGGTPILTNATLRDNIGIDDIIPTIASSATVNPGWNSIIKISGTTIITTLSNGWAGRRIRLIFITVGPGGVATGGNILRTQTAVQNQAIDLIFDGTNWY